jgi:hypothetical protein
MKTVKIRIEVSKDSLPKVDMNLNIAVPDEETLYETVVRIQDIIKKENILMKRYGKKFNPSKRKHCR